MDLDMYEPISAKLKMNVGATSLFQCNTSFSLEVLM